MPYSIKTPAVAEVVTLTEAKAHLRVADTVDDTYITGLIAVAKGAVESRTGAVLATTTFTYKTDYFPANRTIYLRRTPLQSVTSVKYRDGAGVLQTLSSANYSVDETFIPGRIVLKDGYSWPQTWNNPLAVEIEFVAGYAALVVPLPAEVKQAVLMLVDHYYAYRGVLAETGAREMPVGIEQLILPYKTWS